MRRSAGAQPTDFQGAGTLPSPAGHRGCPSNQHTGRRVPQGTAWPCMQPATPRTVQLPYPRPAAAPKRTLFPSLLLTAQLQGRRGLSLVALAVAVHSLQRQRPQLTAQVPLVTLQYVWQAAGRAGRQASRQPRSGDWKRRAVQLVQCLNKAGLPQLAPAASAATTSRPSSSASKALALSAAQHRSCLFGCRPQPSLAKPFNKL